MGALHKGHCHLVAKSLDENDKTMVSIFVNPSQFAPGEDLDDYPRTLDRDLEILKLSFLSRPVDAVFVPKVSQMYPLGIDLDVSKQRGAFVTVHGCSEKLEGQLRPGFFRGVATVVTKLFNIVAPTRAYFGQKDAQQCVVVRNLVKDLWINTEIRVQPTLREQNGLAMSSRNEYLQKSVRDSAAVIYRGLCAGKRAYENLVSEQKEVPALTIVDAVAAVFSAMPQDWEVEYVAVSDSETLDDLQSIGVAGATLLTAVRVPRADGGVARLIDNVVMVGK